MSGGSSGAGTYTAGLFAGFTFTDLKYAYEENFLPEEAVREFENRPVFETTDEYLAHRQQETRQCQAYHTTVNGNRYPVVERPHYFGLDY
jgi:hypothetical protein